MKNRTGNVKKSAFLITFFLLFAASAAYASGIASLNEKVFSYIDNNKELKPLINNSLWFTSKNKEVELYANKVVNSKGNPIGDFAVLAYGTISQDSSEISIKDEQTGQDNKFSLVNCEYEYYFTDMVFIQQKYEEALIDLYFMKVTYPERQIMEEAINNTLWIAEQNGVKLSKEQILASFTKELDERVALIEQRLNTEIAEYFPITTKYSKKIAQATKEYYLNPNIDTYNKWKNSFFSLLDDIRKGPAVYIEGVNMSKHIRVGTITPTLERASGLYFPSFSDNTNAYQVKE